MKLGTFYSGKYSPLVLNSILMDPLTQIDKQIPQKYKHKSFIYFFFLSVLRLIFFIAKTIISAPFCYKFAGVKRYHNLYNKKVVFLLPSINNQRSLNRIVESLRFNNISISIIDKGVSYVHYPMIPISLFSVMALPFCWKLFLGVTESEKRIMTYFIDNYILSPGLVWFYYKIIRDATPDCVIMANDHGYSRKALEYVCEDYGVKTIYVQHAPVCDNFPELHFKYNFLDGQDSFTKYTLCGKKIQGETFLLGAIRHDNLAEYRKNRTVQPRKTIGVGVNPLDDIQVLSSFCTGLMDIYPGYDLKIRLHPSIKDFNLSIKKPDRVFITSARDENVIDFFDTIDFLIAGDSGIHLDAVLSGVPTVVANFTRSGYVDSYDFVSCGMLKYANSFNDIPIMIEFINEHGVDETLVRRYDASFNKSYSGNSSAIVSDFILNHYSISYLTERYKMVSKMHNDNKFYYIEK